MEKPKPVVVIKRSSSSLKFGSLLTLIFVIAKIWGYIDWSWWWVFCPLWIPVAVVFGVIGIAFGIFLLILAIAAILDAIERRK